MVFQYILRKTIIVERVLGVALKLPHRTAAHAHRVNYSMDQVYIRNTAGTDVLYISFRYTNKDLRVDRNFNFCRKMNEKVDDALARIRNNIEKELNKGAKKGRKKSPAQVQEPLPVSEIAVEFKQEGRDTKITDITFAEMLGDKSNHLQMRVLDCTYDITFNLPWIENLVLPTSILAGFTVYPTKIELQFAERKYSKGAWFKAKLPPSGDLLRGAEWSHCADGIFYNSTNDDVGYYLKFIMTPGNAEGELGPSIENIAKNEVQASPGHCPFATRHCFTTQRLSGDSIRLMSYNILADLYADSDYTRTVLFPYCPAYALKIEYRKQLFMKEIIGYNADIICLQEVDMKIFDMDLMPMLESPEFGYRGLMAQKSTTGEGEATFYRADRFELIQTDELNIGDNIRNLPEFAHLLSKISNNEQLIKRICDRSTTLQSTVLKCNDNGRYLLVANTHLFFHPDADHIRLLQMGFCMLYIEDMYKKVMRDLSLNDDKQLALIFCGDFNSVPECGIYKLMTDHFVGQNCIDWSSNKQEAVKNVSLTQPFSMSSACGTPRYTNYTHGFKACLDYIFYQNDCLEVQQVIPFPTEDELSAHIAIPSVVFPSDHVALVADLKFKTAVK